MGALFLLLSAACAEPMASVDASADAGPSCAPTVDFVAALADPLAPARRLPGRAFLASSRSPEPQEGMHNDDLAHFLGTDGPRVILADEDGPGVITRLWFTYGPPPLSISDVPIRLTIDGRDVIVDQPLGYVAGASSPVVPAPWALDPSIASGGLSILSPIQFQSHARVELTVADGAWAYYQVDVRRLPADACVRSFDGAYGDGDRASLDAGAALWQRHEHPGDDETVAARSLAAGESTELALTGMGAITVLEVTAPVDARASLQLRIEADGETAADAPLAWLTGGAPPAGTYTSAFTASTATSATLYAPIPYASSARVVVTNAGSASASVGLRVRSVEMPLASDVGRFHAECASAVASIPVPTEQPPFEDTFPNIVLARFSGRPGQYVGLTTFQTAPNPWWWALEPDHEIAIDGSYDVMGTGTEDYFGGAFYFMNGPYASMTSGASGWMRPVDATMPIPATHTHLYRHHIVDTIPFDDELRFEMESYVDGTGYDGCAFFYLF